VRQGRQGGKVDKEEESSTIQTYEDLIIFYDRKLHLSVFSKSLGGFV
jgi:hypothetical protein